MAQQSKPRFILKRPPGPTEMIPDFVDAYYDTIGPQTFDRPVMLSFGCSTHPALGDHATFDVMVTWAQIEELEAAIERVRKMAADESSWRVGGQTAKGKDE